jgi:hypothetical protein
MRILLVPTAALMLFSTMAVAQTTNAAMAGRVDTCRLVTKAEVQLAVGLPVADPKPNASNPALCDFKVGDYGVVGFAVQPNRPGETPDRIMSELAKRKMQPVEVKGIGDRAFFTSPGYGMVQLNTFKGSNYAIITLMVPGASPEKVKAAAEQLMKKALLKL